MSSNGNLLGLGFSALESRACYPFVLQFLESGIGDPGDSGSLQLLYIRQVELSSLVGI